MSRYDAETAELQARVGTTLGGKYRLVKMLGRGGMGAVFEALNTWTERRVAIKVMIGQEAHDADVVSRFLREARAAAKIDHPNIVDVLDMGQDADDGTLYIVQEFLTGRDLRSVLDDKGRLDAKGAYEALVPILAALVAAHELGIVHRDLKPENIFIQRTPTGSVPKLIDFGIAKVIERGRPAQGLTKTGAAMGTPHYMSPEQARGEKAIDAQTDVWAMGAVWFELLAGRCPFEGDSYNALLAQILTEPVPAITGFAPDVVPGLAAAIHRALERDRKVRYPSMRAFLRALLEVRELRNTEWFETLRGKYVPLVGSEEYDEAPTRVAAVNELKSPQTAVDMQFEETALAEQLVTPRLASPRSSTLGRSAREIDARGANPVTTRRGAIVAAVIALASIGGFIVFRTVGSSSNVGNRRGAVSEPSAVVPVAPIVPAVADAGSIAQPVPSAPPPLATGTIPNPAVPGSRIVPTSPPRVTTTGSRTTIRTQPPIATPATPVDQPPTGTNTTPPSTTGHRLTVHHDYR